jgi:hypothetical protein
MRNATGDKNDRKSPFPAEGKEAKHLRWEIELEITEQD